MSRLINIGFGNMVNAAKIVAIISPDSAPSKRIVQNAKDEGRAIDATQGRRTRAVIIMTDDHVVFAAGDNCRTVSGTGYSGTINRYRKG